MEIVHTHVIMLSENRNDIEFTVVMQHKIYKFQLPTSSNIGYQKKI